MATTAGAVIATAVAAGKTLGWTPGRCFPLVVEEEEEVVGVVVMVVGARRGYGPRPRCCRRRR